jgi:hypothetical protein
MASDNSFYKGKGDVKSEQRTSTELNYDYQNELAYLYQNVVIVSLNNTIRLYPFIKPAAPFSVMYSVTSDLVIDTF